MSILRKAMKKEKEWVKVHAAEMLLTNNLFDDVRETFQTELQKEPGPYYRIGVWRVLAQAAASDRISRAKYIEEIAAVLKDKNAPDRELAMELEKLIRVYPDQPELKYALVRLSALSQDSGVRDSVRALTLANQLAPEQPTPPNIQALALAAAADGQFEQAARLQQQVIQMLGWMAPPQQLHALQETLAAYEKGVMPQQSIWPADDPLLSPGPLNPAEPFREYPTAVPF